MSGRASPDRRPHGRRGRPGASDRRARGSPGRDRRLFLGGRRAVAEAVRAGRATEVLVADDAERSPGLREVLTAAEAAGVRVRATSREELDRAAPDHQGVMARVALPAALGERDLRTMPFDGQALAVVLDGITDPQNLGAAARAAEVAGADLLVTRVRRGAPVTAAALRASAGALLHLAHAEVANLPRALDALKDRGFGVVALDESAARTVYEEPPPEGPVALVVGSEGAGISRLVLERCDVRVRLPVMGRVSSLNAAAALAAGLFAYIRRPPAAPGYPGQSAPQAGVAQPGSASDL